MPTSPKPPSAVQVLTLDYLIDGYTDVEEAWAFFENLSRSTSPTTILSLSSVRLHSTGSLAELTPAPSTWQMPYEAALVAVLPRDEASLAYATKKNAGLRYAFPAVVSVGPYAIRGKLLSSQADIRDLTFLYVYRSLVLREAEINCLKPGSQLTGLQAPLAIVHTELLQGISLQP